MSFLGGGHNAIAAESLFKFKFWYHYFNVIVFHGINMKPASNLNGNNFVN